MSGIGIVLVLLIIGFASGYAVREFISQRRRADAKRRGGPL